MSFTFASQAEPASDEELGELAEVSGQILPETYLSLLKYSNGGEWPIAVEPFEFMLFDVRTVIGNLIGTDFTEVFPDCVPIGGDGMSEYVALDFATKPVRVVAIDATDEDPEASLYPVAATFEEFVAFIGRDPEES